jgi:membrane protein DedA with SNARE-associated domain
MQAIFNDAINTLLSWIDNVGYPAVFVATFLETLFPPIPSEVIFPIIGYTAQNKGLGLWHAIGMATIGALGSTVGAIIIYFVALKVRESAIILSLGRYTGISKSKLEKVELLFRKHGEIAVFLGRMLPGIREIISIPAGISKMNLSKFIIFTFSGSFVWSTTLTLLGYYLGQAWISKFFSEEILSSIFSLIAIIIIIGILIVVIGFKCYRKHKLSTKKLQ